MQSSLSTKTTKRFTLGTASMWKQHIQALQWLEQLIKNRLAVGQSQTIKPSFVKYCRAYRQYNAGDSVCHRKVIDMNTLWKIQYHNQTCTSYFVYLMMQK